MSEKNIFKKIIAFIEKDTKAKNESKKTIVVIREILISVLVYFSINAIIGNVMEDIRSTFFYFVFFVAFVGILACSYRFRTVGIILMFNIGMLIFILVILYFFGWNVGVQHFLMVMLLLSFFSGYQKYKQKFIYAGFLCVVRIILFYMYRDRDPFLPLTDSNIDILQIVNTITIFWCISLIAYTFSRDGQEQDFKLVQYNEQLENLANTDNLTGLYNRRMAWEYLDSLVQDRSVDFGISLCICDIDFFKKVNDTYGHDMGDEVLKNVADIFKEEMSGEDFVARWGGEEFLLIFPKCNGDDAYVKLVNLKSKIKHMRIKKDDIEIGITMTFGLAEYDYSKKAEDTIKEADNKLYYGKEHGRDQIVY